MGINVIVIKQLSMVQWQSTQLRKLPLVIALLREHQVFHLLEIIIHLNLLSWVYLQVSVVNFLCISFNFFHWAFGEMSLYLVEENREAPLIAQPPYYKTELCAIFMLCLISQSMLRGQTMSCRSLEAGVCLSLLSSCGRQQPSVE